MRRARVSKSCSRNTRSPSRTMPRSSTPAAATTADGRSSLRARTSRIVRHAVRSSRPMRSQRSAHLLDGVLSAPYEHPDPDPTGFNRGGIFMSASSAAMASSTSGPAFWERLWRTAGIQAVGLFVIAYFICGHQPQVGASADALAAFYDAERTRILIAAVLYGMALLNLLWFAAAIRATLADAGQDGWGAAATAASAAVGALFLVFTAIGTALAYPIAPSGNQAL